MKSLHSYQKLIQQYYPTFQLLLAKLKCMAKWAGLTWINTRASGSIILSLVPPVWVDCSTAVLGWQNISHRANIREFSFLISLCQRADCVRDDRLYKQYQKRVGMFWPPITTLKGIWLLLTLQKSSVEKSVYGIGETGQGKIKTL